MRSLGQVLDELESRDDCAFRPAARIPVLPAGLSLLPDAEEFYARFSEARLFGYLSDPRYHILPPEQFVPIGIAVCGRPASASVQQSWYALAHVRDGNYIAIDCHPARLGYCYDAFHETIDLLDYCQVIAHSFTELMNRAMESGDEAWWLSDKFKTYGYADQFGGAAE